ncbi:MAG: hypothetical protein ACTSVV_09635, partial [Promethearchaeota archaeon]
QEFYAREDSPIYEWINTLAMSAEKQIECHEFESLEFFNDNVLSELRGTQAKILVDHSADKRYDQVTKVLPLEEGEIQEEVEQSKTSKNKDSMQNAKSSSNKENLDNSKGKKNDAATDELGWIDNELDDFLNGLENMGDEFK